MEGRTGHLALLVFSRALLKQRQTGPGSGNKDHALSESPAILLATLLRRVTMLHATRPTHWNSRVRADAGTSNDHNLLGLEQRVRDVLEQQVRPWGNMDGRHRGGFLVMRLGGQDGDGGGTSSSLEPGCFSIDLSASVHRDQPHVRISADILRAPFL
jgi:hypothetical protein